jgi:peptidoglycan/LPS O-acetylase OafA/YrhL
MRNPAIDVLRALAVLLVLGRHAHWPTGSSGEIWQCGGWIGVDLFFVLSGFLVSGLLFRELAATGDIDWRRFFIRRGFKIYPAFYCLLAFTLVFNALTGAAPFTWRQTLSESLFVQNYGQPLWGHTWSLAVEEHFYLLLPGLILVCNKWRMASLPRLILVLSLVILALRIMTARVEYAPQLHLFPTHLRLDSLLFGVLLSYYYHRDPARFSSFARRYRLGLLAGATALALPPFIWPLESTPLLYTVGLTGLYLAGGAFLSVVVSCGWPSWLLRDRLAWVGSYSYSIYLWHAAVLEWIFPASSLAAIGCYMFASVAIGIAMSKLIEMPMLRLRDTLFAARGLRQSKLSGGLAT